MFLEKTSTIDGQSPEPSPTSASNTPQTEPDAGGVGVASVVEVPPLSEGLFTLVRGTGRRISLSCVVDGGVEGKGQYYVLVSQGDGHRLSHGSLKALFPFGSILISEGVV